MKPLTFLLEMFANKEYYNLIKYSILNNDLESRIKADNLAPELHTLWFECNNIEILELEKFIINN